MPYAALFMLFVNMLIDLGVYVWGWLSRSGSIG